jgi:capsule polysaccharide modification protein KpsS
MKENQKEVLITKNDGVYFARVGKSLFYCDKLKEFRESLREYCDRHKMGDARIIYCR